MPNNVEPQVFVGVDTHADVHVAVAIDQQGHRLGSLSIQTTAGGYAELLAWARQLGDIAMVGIEGTGTFGAGLNRYLATLGISVVEVDRPDRRSRRTHGKTDEIDAEIAARSVLAGIVRTIPKASDGYVEAIRMLRLAKRSAVKARTQAANQLHALVVTLPDHLRAQLRGLSVIRLVDVVCRWRIDNSIDPTSVGRYVVRSVARRYRALDDEIKELHGRLATLVALVAPQLLTLPNVGPDTAAALLIAAGDNPDRLHSEAAFAHLCGSAPLSASSGKSHRHRLNRGGNREANSALYTIVLGRMYRDERTRAYVDRRTTEGLSKREIMRCLKRFVAREVYRALVSPPNSDAVVVSSRCLDANRAA